MARNVLWNSRTAAEYRRPFLYICNTESIAGVVTASRFLGIERIYNGFPVSMFPALHGFNSPVNTGVEKRAQLNGAFGPMLIIQCLASLSDVSWNFRLCTENGH